MNIIYQLILKFLLSEKYLNMKHHNKPSLKLTRNIEKSLYKLSVLSNLFIQSLFNSL